MYNEKYFHYAFKKLCVVDFDINYKLFKTKSLAKLQIYGEYQIQKYITF